jgi:Domain of unknown function (DUF5615)
VKRLLDEMYPSVLSERLRLDGVEASCASELGLAGRSDRDLFAAAVDDGYTLVTENVADFARIAAEHLTAGRHHPGVLVALSSRFSRRPAGIAPLVAAIRKVTDEEAADRVIYLESKAGG